MSQIIEDNESDSKIIYSVEDKTALWKFLFNNLIIFFIRVNSQTVNCTLILIQIKQNTKF